jgi:STE24 endopeptidase
MPLLLLLVLTFSCLPVSWPPPPMGITQVGNFLLGCCGVRSSASGSILGSLVLVMSGFMGAIFGAWLGAFVTRTRLTRYPGQRDGLARKQAMFRQYHFIGLLAFQVLALNFLGWGWLAQGAAVEPAAELLLFPGCEICVIAPLLVSLIASWVCFYDAERALQGAADSGGGFYSKRSKYVFFHLRQSMAMVLVPVLLLIGLGNLVRLMPQANPLEQCLTAGTSIAAIGIVFTLMPWILRVVLGLRPMPSGETRTRLMATCERLGFRCSNVLIWDTSRGVANAMVAGILPCLRYVVLTDRLVSDMSPDELEAVFGHEVGHIKHRHMWYYLGFLLASFPVLGQIWQLSNLDSVLGLNRQDLALLPLIPVVGVYIFVVFGFLSRRCERQADIYGCRAVSCGRPDCAGHDTVEALVPRAGGLCPTGIRSFISALEKVAYLNGISRERPGWLQSWQHSTIARRVHFLERVLKDPEVEPKFQRRVGLVKWALLVGLVSTLIVLVAATGWEGLLSF